MSKFLHDDTAAAVDDDDDRAMTIYTSTLSSKTVELKLKALFLIHSLMGTLLFHVKPGAHETVPVLTDSFITILCL